MAGVSVQMLVSLILTMTLYQSYGANLPAFRNCAGCLVGGVCYRNGEVFSDPRPQKKCITLKCVPTQKDWRGPVYFVTEYDQIKCEDANGVCRDQHETGWPLVLRGIWQNNCYCRITRRGGFFFNMKFRCI